MLLLTLLALTSRAQILYTQNTPSVADVIVKEDLDFGRGAIARAADDFEVPSGQTWTINQVDLPGRYRYAQSNGDGGITDRVGAVYISIYTNNSGALGELVYSDTILIPQTQLDPNLEVVIPGGINLESGIYWMTIYTGICCYDESQSWYWKTTATVTHHPALFKSTLQMFANVPNWTPVYEVYPQSPVDMLFTLHGTATGIAASAAPDSLMVSAPDSATFILAWADNSSDETGFVIERSTDGASFSAIATVGAGVTTYSDVDNFDLALRYYYRVAATSGTGTSVYSDVAFADRFEIVYEQSGNELLYGAPSQQWRDLTENGQEGPYEHEKVRSADDILVPENQTWTIKKVVCAGAFYSQSVEIENSGLENATVEIFSDGSPYEITTPDSTLTVSSQPGGTIYKTLIPIPYPQRYDGTVELVLPTPVDLAAGHYWISVYPTTQNDMYWYWGTTYNVHNVVAQENDVRSNPTSTMPWQPTYLAEGADYPLDLMFTLYGAVTGEDFMLAAPVAKPALHVTPTSFVANWTVVEGATRYELDVITVNDSTFLPGYESKIVNGTSQLVTGTKPGKHYRYVVRAVNDETESVNSNSIRVAPIKDLTLRTVCSDNPTVYRRWKIINNNPFAVEVMWRLPNTSQHGTLSAAIGETFFTTQTVPGINYARITWQDDNEHQLSSLKSSTWKSCEAILARGGNVNDDVEDEEIFMVESWPNPVENKFSISVASPADDETRVEILNLQGQTVLDTKTIANTVLQADGTTYSPGLYIIKASQGNKQVVHKFLKK
jgi:hypothetical protein